MTAGEKVWEYVNEVIALAKEHPAGAKLAKFARDKLLAVDLFHGPMTCRSYMRQAVKIVRTADEQPTPLAAMSMLIPAAVVLGTCWAYREHAAYKMLHRAIFSRCRALRGEDQKPVQPNAN